ncbi:MULTISPECIES: hypothetical protein [Nostocales]|uniref:Uncharacterized protein n=1 Tax=Tolypothrix bouteillei VB521301 TaxID=1479485 RepID=A0A8S9TBA2_9CYAN|nr:hypothetical protein [Tolypothrix bouteillei]KAF3889839.1 hypothetical protein DA73_0400033525 [Tolypothrix bouteillei VB521301]KAF3889841.1 hypothetical protein DA73_0400033535 [Tolypothrix bouteillei VB521301]KAF3889843.1 hypothetical protein DA73_0400033545 [Tolypothrix bouteillei VB521301]
MSTSISQAQLFTEMTAEEGATLSGGTARVNLKYFQIYDTQEWPRDEPYLKVDGKTIWSKDGAGVGYHDVGKTFDISGTSDTLSLWENDSWPSNDEFLGENKIYSWQRGTDLELSFTREGANYKLVYDVYSV